MIIFGAIQIVLSQIPDFNRLWWLSIVAAIMSFSYSSIGLGLSIGKAAGIILRVLLHKSVAQFDCHSLHKIVSIKNFVLLLFFHLDINLRAGWAFIWVSHGSCDRSDIERAKDMVGFPSPRKHCICVFVHDDPH